MSVGMKAMKLADHRSECCAGCLHDIEVLKEHDAITGDVEYSASRSLAGCSRNQRAEIRVHKVEPDSVTSRCNGDGVAKVSMALDQVNG